MSADIRCRASYMPGHLRPRSTVHLPAEHSLPVARSQAGVQAGRRFSVLYSLSLAFLVWMLLATPLHALTSEEKELWLAAQEVELLLSDESAPESDPVNDSYSVRSYQVEAGDTLSAIAARFGISRQTIIWANPELHQNPDLLQIGQELIILPVDGAYHKVQAQDTLWDLSHRYGVEIEDIVAYPGNKLLNPEILTLGQKLIIPGATQIAPDPPPPTPTPTPTPAPTPTPTPTPMPTQSTDSAGQGGGPQQRASAQSAADTAPAARSAGGASFIWPARGTFTHGFSAWHPAIDIAAPTGTPVVAAAGGTVSHAGWQSGGYGNLIIIDHGDGFQTYYAHMNTIAVRVGQWVNQGEYLGGMGTTGRTTGPHLHFEIRRNGAHHNPINYLP